MINDEYKIYWIWLQKVLKYGSNKVSYIAQNYESAKHFYDVGERDWRLSGIFTSKEIRDMLNAKISDARKIYNRCKELGYQIVTYQDEEYPDRLKNIQNPPCVLYVSGSAEILNGNNTSVSIVGTRNATVYGMNTAFEMGLNLAKLGVTIVSGGAIGIDTAAHNGAVKGGGKTVAVLACGINYDYLKTNASLRNVIAQNGALVSEYPPDYPVYSSNFIIRNRIVAGMSLCTLVVEAGEKSGSLITANLALDQNRDVFVTVPHDVEVETSKGVMSLIRDGAKVVTDAEQIFKEYNQDYSKSFESKFKVKKIRDELIEKAAKNMQFTEFAEEIKISKPDLKKQNVKKFPEGLSEEAEKVYNSLGDKKYHIDELSVILDMPIKNLLQIMTELEIFSLVKSYSGRMYEKIKF